MERTLHTNGRRQIPKVSIKLLQFMREKRRKATQKTLEKSMKTERAIMTNHGENKKKI